MSAPPLRRPLGEWVDPADLFAGVDAADAFWLDAGVDAPEGWSWIGTGVPSDEPDPLVDGSQRDRPDAAPGGAFSGGWVGWLGYDAAAARAGAPRHADPRDAGALWLRVDRVVAFDHAERTVWLIAPREDVDDFAREVRVWRERAAQVQRAADLEHANGRVAASGPVVDATARVEPEAYAGLVEECRAAIRRGDAYQLCLSTRFEVAADAPFDPLAVFRRLRSSASSHHGALIRSGTRALVSASPERFVQLDGGTLRTNPIKGTRRRGADAASDDALIADLVSSPKERAENVMIVDLMRNDLQRVCEPGSVTVERLLEVETYPTVHQLVSSVAGTLRRGIRLSDVLAATFPAGSMTGAPKLSAMTILTRLEREPRGVYAGCFGWIGDDGDGDLAMVIRSVVIAGSSASVGAGGGITWHSVAGDEVDEVALKARAPLAALGAALPPRWRERVR